MCRDCHINRREFAGLSAALATGFLAASPANGAAEAGESAPPSWDPDLPLTVLGAKLKVQPVLMYVVQEPKDATTYRNWGSVHTEQAAVKEAQRIEKEMQQLLRAADFPLETLPLASVSSVEEAHRVHEKDYDVVVVFPASGSGQLLRACFAAKADRDTLIFARHRSGPLYYWYEALAPVT